MTVIDVTEADFQAQVIDQSAKLPVVVDFWAEWCGPCRTLGPVLEKEAAAREGKVVLAKLDTEANQNIARAFEIQSIPAVKAFSDGKVVADFVGSAPPPQVAKFFDGLIPSEADELADSPDEDALRRAVELEPGHPVAAVKLAQLLHAAGDPAGARTALDGVVDSFQASGLLARISLEELDDPAIDRALRSLDAGKWPGAADGLIALIAEREDQKDRLREVIVGTLDRLGVDHPAVREVRQQLAAALY